MTEWWEYEELPSYAPYDWSPATRGQSEWDEIDFHLDLGCGRLKKARLGIDRYYSEATDLLMDLNTLEVNPPQINLNLEESARFTSVIRRGYDLERERQVGLPFPDNSIRSIVSHHCLEHIGDGFLPLMDECWRILAPGGIFRIIVPLFPSRTAVEDPDHKRYFMAGTFETFGGAADGAHWHESFAVPYTNCRFKICDQDITPPVAPEAAWGDTDVRELRVALLKREEI